MNLEDLTKRNDTARVLLQDVRLELYKHDASWIAHKVGVSTSTIMAFRSGRTVWPRPSTLFGILEAMGYRLTMSKAAEAPFLRTTPGKTRITG